MPGWHAKTKNLAAAGKLKVLGIVEEQHPDRAVLFMQWHQMDWPVMSDPLNLLGVYAIPYTFLIDEHGIIRYKNPKLADLEKFLATEYAEPESIDWPEGVEIAEGSAEHTLLWGRNKSSTASAIREFELRVAESPENAQAHFRLGVAYRKRHDSTARESGDFAKAVGAWRAALDLNSRQYIWRRRIQQYGPRLDKPYSFYDWVVRAREEIIERGEKPHPLAAEPRGSEFANRNLQPAKTTRDAAIHPDPNNKLPVDTGGLVAAEVIAVPSTDGKKPAVRVHLRFSPNVGKKVHWSNDAGRLSFFLDEAQGVEIHDLPAPQSPPTEIASAEERHIEFEVRPAKGGDLPDKLRASAFYYVCEDINGECLFLRQNIEIELRK